MSGDNDWSDQSWPPRSPTQWPEYAPSHPGERLARVEEGLRHVIDKSQTTGERLHAIANRFSASEGRLTIMDAEQRRVLEIVTKLEPIAQEYQRRKDRVRFVKDLLNWLTVPAVFYLAISGRANWAEALAQLAKVFAGG